MTIGFYSSDPVQLVAGFRKETGSEISLVDDPIDWTDPIFKTLVIKDSNNIIKMVVFMVLRDGMRMEFVRKSLPFIYGGCGSGGTNQVSPKKKPHWRGKSNLFMNIARNFKQPSLINASWKGSKREGKRFGWVGHLLNRVGTPSIPLMDAGKKMRT